MDEGEYIPCSNHVVSVVLLLGRVVCVLESTSIKARSHTASTLMHSHTLPRANHVSVDLSV